jgi:hypothetical protein
VHAPGHDISGSVRGLLGHLSTMTRNAITIGGTSFDKISDPPPPSAAPSTLIKAPIPLSLTLK